VFAVNAFIAEAILFATGVALQPNDFIRGECAFNNSQYDFKIMLREEAGTLKDNL
jgi:hypothetical protein